MLQFCVETIRQYKRYPSVATSSNVCELWTKVKTSNSEFFVATVYHPPNPEYNQYDLIDILIDSVEKLLLINPNSKIIIAGDVNQLDIKMLINHLSLAQLVKSPTRGQRLLDVFLTNAPHFWKKTNVEKSLVRSDHNMVLVYPRDIVKASRRTTYFRDVRCQNQIKMMRELEHVNWNVITSNEKISDEMLSKFYEVSHISIVWKVLSAYKSKVVNMRSSFYVTIGQIPPWS